MINKTVTNKIFCIAILIIFALIKFPSVFAKDVIPEDTDLNNLVLMELDNGGIVIIEMFPNIAPGHVYRIKLLVANKFYDGLEFFRAIKDFIVQTGDPNNDGTGGSNLGRIDAEISDLKHVRGTVSMARAININSANSQFFIVTANKAPHLDNQYTIWGRVIYGMEYIDSIKTATNEENGIVEEPTKIVKMRLGQDMNFAYDDDTKEIKEARQKQRIAILNNLEELKLLNEQANLDNQENVYLIDRIFDFNDKLD